MQKKAVSGVVEAILIVVITIAAATMLFAFIIPTLQKWMDDSRICHTMTEQFSVKMNEYTCVNGSETKIMIQRDDKENPDLEGFRISLSFAGNSSVFDIKNNTQVTGVEMYDKATRLRLPSPGGSETYVFKGLNKTESFIIVPIATDGKLCSDGMVNGGVGRC